MLIFILDSDNVHVISNNHMLSTDEDCKPFSIVVDSNTSYERSELVHCK